MESVNKKPKLESELDEMVKFMIRIEEIKKAYPWFRHPSLDTPFDQIYIDYIMDQHDSALTKDNEKFYAKLAVDSGYPGWTPFDAEYNHFLKTKGQDFADRVLESHHDNINDVLVRWQKKLSKISNAQEEKIFTLHIIPPLRAKRCNLQVLQSVRLSKEGVWDYATYLSTPSNAKEITFSSNEIEDLTLDREEEDYWPLVFWGVCFYYTTTACLPRNQVRDVVTQLGELEKKVEKFPKTFMITNKILSNIKMIKADLEKEKTPYLPRGNLYVG